MKRDAPDQDYEFAVSASKSYENPSQLVYEVSMPHQCDSWKILGWDYTDQTDAQVAVKQMRLFVQRAQEALDALERIVATGKPGQVVIAEQE